MKGNHKAIQIHFLYRNSIETFDFLKVGPRRSYIFEKSA